MSPFRQGKPPACQNRGSCWRCSLAALLSDNCGTVATHSKQRGADLDPQASLTTLFGLAPEVIAPGQTLYGALRYDTERLPIRSVIRKIYIPGLDLIPAAIELMEFEHETPRMLTKSQSPDLFLRRVTDELDAVDFDYDLVIIDCLPNSAF